MGAGGNGARGDRGRLTLPAGTATKRPGGLGIETLTVAGESPAAAAVERAVRVLLGGGLLIYPTDTLYALGGRALDSSAAGRVRTAKGRQAGKPLPLIAADARQAADLAAAWSDVAGRLAERFWPGPLTLVLPAAQGLPEDLTQGVSTIAVRVPALLLARLLCARAGPLISTSANRSGGHPPVTCAEAIVQVGTAVALALDAGPGRPAPSTLVDLTSGTPRLLRAGALPWPAIREVCSGRDVP